jgi:hypothetical protein
MRRVSVGRLLRSFYLLYFSQPAGDRALYRVARSRPLRSIVEIGIGSTTRTQRLLEIALWRASSAGVRYTGIDLFEARPSGRQALTLKHAFAALKRPHVHLQLVPGEADAALKRVANALTKTDLVVISADETSESLARAWTWMPRMLTPESLVLLEEAPSKAGQPAWRPLKLPEIQRLAAEAAKSLRRAA